MEQQLRREIFQLRAEKLELERELKLRKRYQALVSFALLLWIVMFWVR